MPESQGQAGEVVGGRFVLERELGLGGFGSVWLAADRASTGGSAALKLLHPRHRADNRVLDRFVREARILEKLDHPNIARPIAWSVDGSYAFIAMEYVAGTPLSHEIVQRARQGLRFSDEDLLDIFEQLISAVDHATKKDIVHRDLKPSNVMLIRTPERLIVKVLDFGLAKIVAEDKHDATTVGRVFGSHLYCSPEQARGLPVDVRSDVFGLGTILFELMTLCRAWAIDERGKPLRMMNLGVVREPPNDNLSIGLRIASAPRPRPSDVVPELGPAVDAVIARALAIDPSTRYASARELGFAFMEALRTLGPVMGAAPLTPIAPLELPDLPDTMVAPRELVAPRGEVTRSERPAAGSAAASDAITKLERPSEPGLMGEITEVPEPPVPRRSAPPPPAEDPALRPSAPPSRPSGPVPARVSAPAKMPEPTRGSSIKVSVRHSPPWVAMSVVAILIGAVAVTVRLGSFSGTMIDPIAPMRDEPGGARAIGGQQEEPAAQDVLQPPPEPSQAPIAERPDREPEPAPAREEPRPSRRVGTKTAAARPTPVPAPAPQRHPALAAIAESLARARKTPDDYPQIRALGQQMLQAKDQIQDRDVRNSVERCVTGAAFMGDVDLEALERCFKKMEAAFPVP